MSSLLLHPHSSTGVGRVRLRRPDRFALLREPVLPGTRSYGPDFRREPGSRPPLLPQVRFCHANRHRPARSAPIVVYLGPTPGCYVAADTLQVYANPRPRADIVQAVQMWRFELDLPRRPVAVIQGPVAGYRRDRLPQRETLSRWSVDLLSPLPVFLPVPVQRSE